jgi:hypothetical protein
MTTTTMRGGDDADHSDDVDDEDGDDAATQACNVNTNPWGLSPAVFIGFRDPTRRAAGGFVSFCLGACTELFCSRPFDFHNHHESTHLKSSFQPTQSGARAFLRAVT